MGKYPMRKLSLIKFTTNMIWFERFVRGVEIWVVRNSRPDQAIIVEVMNILIENMEPYIMIKGPTV